VQALDVLISVPGIPRHVRAVRTLVSRLLAVAGARHVPLQVGLLKVTVGTVQALIRPVVPGTIGIPLLIP